MNKIIRKSRFEKKPRPKDGRVEILRGIFILFGAAIIIKLFMLQIIQGGFYAALASDQHEIYKTLFPLRGEIFVRDHNSLSEEPELYPMATNKEYKTIYAQPRFISNPKMIAEILSPILEISIEDLMIRLDKPNDPYEVLKRKIEDDVYQQILALDLEGIKFQTEMYRFYPEGNIGSSVLGFVGQSQEHRVGQYGVEGYFEDILSGEPGALQSEKDVAGRWISSTSKYYTPAINGSDIVLTLDKTIQYTACSILNEQAELYQAESAALVIMDPFTGAIMAMCSFPDFDPNDYGQVESVEAYNNTSVFEAYEPGSIFKPITMAAALDMRIVTPETTYIDTGEVKVDKYTIHNSDFLAHGKVNMIDVLDLSLNTGMIFVVDRLGAPNLKRYVENFGFGKHTDIQLDTEVGGNISLLSKQGDVYSFTASYGQGLTVTPLQMVQAFSVIANGGYLVKPYIVDEIITNEKHVKTEPKVLRKVLDQKTTTLLSGMLVSVVKNGHARLADVDGYNIAGKTGTAQIADFENGGYSNRTNHSFVGFGPLDNPVYTMIVKFENPKVGGFGASTAAPTFGRISDFILKYMKVPPDDLD